MNGPQIHIIELNGNDDDDAPEMERFRNMVEEFNYFLEKSQDPFGPCGFLHQLLEKALDRAYGKAYACIGQAQDPNPFICAATHLKRCKELSAEMTDQISAAMGDMHRGNSEAYNLDMMKAVGNLMRLVNGK